MKWHIKNRISDKHFIKTCQEAQSMAKAAAQLNLHFNSFKKRAIELGCYKPNQAGKGLKRIAPKIPMEDIIQKGLHPHYQTFKLKKRLLAEKIKTNQCEVCKTTQWQGQPLNMELHHIDGDRTNHHIHNLQMICPNCHSQTDNFRAKNKSAK